MYQDQPLETRRQFLSRSGALIAGLAGVPLLPPDIAAGDEPLGTLDLGLERAFVLFELHLFETHYLPALHAPFRMQHRDSAPRLTFWHGKDGRLEQWQAATRRLAAALKSSPHLEPGLEIEEFQTLFIQRCPDTFKELNHSYLLNRPVRRCCSLRQGRIRWHYYPIGSVRPDPECRAREAFHLLHLCFGLPLPPIQEPPNACAQLRNFLPEVKELFRRLDPLDGAHFAAYEYLLPLLSEVAPSWAVQALDRDRMEHEVRTDRQLSPGEQDQRLRRLSCHYVSRYLSSAHALVMASLANNHFCAIDNLFGHPEIYGSANRLMIEVIFAVLYRKIGVLRQPGGPHAEQMV